MNSCDGTNDSDIRSAFHAKRLKHLKSHPETLVIDELGLAHAKSRIDIAVINGCIHGYEIKSARDTLERLSAQIDIYRQTLQKLTIVAASNHLLSVVDYVPKWCGVIEAKRGPKGSIRFTTVQGARINPDIDPVMLAHLLWRNEVISLLSQIGYAPGELRRPRKQLYEMLCDVRTPNQIIASIKAFMAQRQAWRDHQVRA